MVDMLREEKQKQHPQLYTAVEKDMDAAAGSTEEGSGEMQINNTVNTNSRFFMMPNEVYQLGLSTGAIATYGYLMSRENRKRDDKEQYTCHPSYATIGEAIGRSARSVAKYVAELVEAGLVSTEPTKVTTKDGQRWNGNLKYTLLPIESAVALFHECQLAKLETGVQKKRKAMAKATRSRERKQIPHAEYVATRSAHEPEELPL